MLGRAATPLIAIDAVVIDTETTGLDPASARIVEIAAVRIRAGTIEPDNALRRLVQPGVPIPEAATAVHGIDAAAVAGAPAFAAAWPEVEAFIANSVLIGHTVGFDLAVLARECRGAGLAFDAPRTLDTRLLAQVCKPDLAGFTLESLCAWLGVDVVRRHSALGDALTTAQVFQALLPRLREGHIRTVAEADRACRALTRVLDEQHRAGWLEGAAAAAPDAAPVLGRIDSYPYRHRVRDVMRAPAEFVPATMPLRDVLAVLMEKRVSSVFVDGSGEAAPRSATAGIVTERDVLRTVAADGAEALARTAGEMMSRPLACVPQDAFVYRAIGRMGRLGVRHLGVEDEGGRVVGALSARDLLKLRTSEAVYLGDAIDEARDVPALAAAFGLLPQTADSLLSEGVPARDIAAVISREIGALTRAAARIAQERMRAGGEGEPPCPYAVAVLGSAGRDESLLAFDQDNALIFAEGEPGGAADRWFEKLGVLIADILHEIGIPYCKGGVMTSNAQWRGSLATWRERVRQWIAASRPEDLLSVDIFFDLRPVFGDSGLALALRREAFDMAEGNIPFIKLLAESCAAQESGLTMFGRFKAREGRIDLKKTGLFGIVTLARVLAVRHRVLAASTQARLTALQAAGVAGESHIAPLLGAHTTFVHFLLRQQIADIRQGRPVSTGVDVKTLSGEERARLRDALSAVEHLDELMRDLIFAR